MSKSTTTLQKHPGAIYTGPPQVLYENQNFGKFPLLLYQPVKINGNYRKALAPYSSITVFDNIRKGHAQILTFDLKLKSIFTLKCHFHSNDRKFTYRSDKYPGTIEQEYQRMIALAAKNALLCYSMQLYDNRRSAPDDILIKWTGTEITYRNEFLPFQVKKITDSEIDSANRFYQSIKNKVYETFTGQV